MLAVGQGEVATKGWKEHAGGIVENFCWFNVAEYSCYILIGRFFRAAIKYTVEKMSLLLAPCVPSKMNIFGGRKSYTLSMPSWFTWLLNKCSRDKGASWRRVIFCHVYFLIYFCCFTGWAWWNSCTILVARDY